ncbi:MAG: undecaprenyl-diphosphate phosphatase [Verrucomicrobia bacterium]|jgi:undecaprenyl-diphosphatase|nr:undecaprenyl-diphosphate phosphatase [Verrucomicrobiota bacterium]
MPDWIAAILLGIVEGITEFLPISSTGHLLLVQQWVPRQSDLFNIVIQASAVIAILPLFPERLNQFLHRWREPATRDYLAKLIAAFVITGVGGLGLDRLGFALPEKTLPIALALLIGGILFLAIERHLQGHRGTEQITWTIAWAVGAGQLLAAVFPGASRSGTTILLTLLLGLSRPAATEFSFLVGIPTMLAASALKIFEALGGVDDGATGEDWGVLLIGCVASAIVSFVAVRWLLRYVQTHTFVAFGWYRIALASVILALLAWQGELAPEEVPAPPAIPELNAAE